MVVKVALGVLLGLLLFAGLGLAAGEYNRRQACAAIGQVVEGRCVPNEWLRR